MPKSFASFHDHPYYLKAFSRNTVWTFKFRDLRTRFQDKQDQQRTVYLQSTSGVMARIQSNALFGLVDMGRWVTQSTAHLANNVTILTRPQQWHTILHIRPLTTKRQSSADSFPRPYRHIALRRPILHRGEGSYTTGRDRRRRGRAPPFQSRLLGLWRPRNEHQGPCNGGNEDGCQLGRVSRADQISDGLGGRHALERGRGEDRCNGRG